MTKMYRFCHGTTHFPVGDSPRSNKAKIYQTPIRGVPNYTLCWYEGATRKRQVFADLGEAKREGQLRVDALARGEAEIIRLSGIERLEYLRAREALDELSIPLDTVAKEYQEARRILNGVSILTAAKHYAAMHRINTPKRTVTQVVEEILQAKRQAGLSERYLEDLESRLGDFAKTFQCDIQAVTGPLIKTWLQEKKIANRTRNNFRLAVQTLVSFAKDHQYLPQDWDELKAVPIWKTVSEEVEIFTPAEMAKLLSVADAKLLPYLVIGGFAGLRTAEIERLDWADIDLSSGYIRVSASKSKTGSRRLVPIADNLRSWLGTLARESGPVIELANLANGIQRLVQSAGALRRKSPAAKNPATPQWKHNALRHSFCSYRLAIVKNAPQVALEAGNSPSMIFEHYRELVTESQANDWFGLLPS